MENNGREAVQNRNTTADFLKGIAILLVLITHYAWTPEQRKNPLFPYVVDMAVPIFMIISGYMTAMSFQKHKIDALSTAYEKREILRKVIRYTVPFLIIVVWQVLDPNVVKNYPGILNKTRWVLNGTVGPGSYYYPILMQLVFTAPILFFIVKRKGKYGL